MIDRQNTIFSQKVTSTNFLFHDILPAHDDYAPENAP